MSEVMVQFIWLHIKTQTCHDDKVSDECLRKRTVQMSQFSGDMSSHASLSDWTSDETLVCSSSEVERLKETLYSDHNKLTTGSCFL